MVSSTGKVMITYFLKCARCDLYRLFRERKNCHRTVLYRFNGPIRCWIKGKTVSFGAKKFCSTTTPCTGSLLCSWHNQIGRIALQIAAAFIVLSGFGFLRLFVFNLKKIAWWKEIHVKWGDYRRNRDLFCRIQQIVFFREVKKMAGTLDKVYPPKSGLL